MALNNGIILHKTTVSNEHFRARGATPPYPTPNIVIESLNMNDTRRLRGKEGDDTSWANYDAVFRSTFERLRVTGADLAVIASNTPHIRFDNITCGLNLPVVSVIDATASAVRALGGTRALVLGTPVTMQSAIYTNTLREFGVETIPRLGDDDIARLELFIDLDLYQARISDARRTILDLCSIHLVDRASDIVCLACTELPIAFPEHKDLTKFEVDGISFVNTAVAHVDAVLHKAWS